MWQWLQTDQEIKAKPVNKRPLTSFKLRQKWIKVVLVLFLRRFSQRLTDSGFRGLHIVSHGIFRAWLLRMSRLETTAGRMFRAKLFCPGKKSVLLLLLHGVFATWCVEKLTLAK